MRRVELAEQCRDADSIPKVPEAGQVMERDGTRVQVMHNGVVVEEGCYYGEMTTEVVRRLRGHHEPQQELAFHAVIEQLRSDTESPVVVELGSYWAFYSLWALHEIPGTRCVLVEPDPNHLEVGQRNLALNGKEARSIQAAVGVPDGAVVPDFVCESDKVAREVPLATVEGIMAREELPRIDLLLCDAEGSELDMIAGARSALMAGRIRFLVISTHHHRISGDPLMHSRCLQGLTFMGAHVIAEHTVSESFSGDGLIVASFDPRDNELTVELSHARARQSLFGEPEHYLAAAMTERDELAKELERLRAQ